MNDQTPARIFVTIGTDHHQFDRILDWIDRWLEAHPEFASQTLVQHGQTRPSRLARNTSFVEYQTLMGHLRDADVVITHGGPASIFESRNQGRLPIAVPRDPEHDEIIDGHQQRFARYLAKDEMLFLAEDEQTFVEKLEWVLADPHRADVVVEEARLKHTMENLDQIVHELRSEKPFWARLLPSRKQ